MRSKVIADKYKTKTQHRIPQMKKRWVQEGGKLFRDPNRFEDNESYEESDSFFFD